MPHTSRPAVHHHVATSASARGRVRGQRRARHTMARQPSHPPLCAPPCRNEDCRREYPQPRNHREAGHRTRRGSRVLVGARERAEAQPATEADRTRCATDQKAYARALRQARSRQPVPANTAHATGCASAHQQDPSHQPQTPTPVPVPSPNNNTMHATASAAILPGRHRAKDRPRLKRPRPLPIQPICEGAATKQRCSAAHRSQRPR